MDAADRSVRRASDQLQELADEITDPVNQWQLVAVWRSRALAALQRAPGLDSTWSERFETVVENLALPAPSLAEDWDIYEFEGRFHEARGVLIEAAESLRAQVETNEAAHAERTDGLTRREVTKLVNQYIGVSGGYLGDFSYRSNSQELWMRNLD
jgi:hypothetical protein